MHTYFIRTLMLAGLILLPAAGAEAYFTTDQHALGVTDTSAIYLIEFKFGHDSHDIRIPVSAVDTKTNSRDFISYALMNDEEERAEDIRSAGIVLANAPIQNGAYVVPKGESRTFTLMVVASATDDAARQDVRAEVTYLPFNFDGTEPLQLNPSELQYYATPSLLLPSPVRVTNIEIHAAQ